MDSGWLLHAHLEVAFGVDLQHVSGQQPVVVVLFADVLPHLLTLLVAEVLVQLFFLHELVLDSAFVLVETSVLI